MRTGGCGNRRVWNPIEGGWRSSEGTRVMYERACLGTYGEECEFTLYASFEGRPVDITLHVRRGERVTDLADEKLDRLASGWDPFQNVPWDPFWEAHGEHLTGQAVAAG